MTTTYDMSKKTIVEDFGVVPNVPKKVEEKNTQEPSGELMAKLEKEGMEKLAAAKGGDMWCIPAEKTLENIMQAGMDQFKKETGRGMTYGEMRDLYG
jgi:hypothetical protein